MAAGAARASGKAVGTMVSGATSTGKSYRLWRLTRKLDSGLCTASVSTTSCGDFLDELGPTQRQELRRMLIALDEDGVRLANKLGPKEIDRLLAHHIDDYAAVEEGLVVRGSRHGIEVEARYMDDGKTFVDDLADGEDLSKGAIGEETAYEMAKERNYEVPGWFEKDSEYQNGIDLIAKDTETGEWVFIESKFSSSRGSVDIGDLSNPDTKGRQMSDEWLVESIEDLRASGTMSDEEARDLTNAIRFGDSRKEMVVVKNTQQSGFTVAESLNDIDIDGATIYKTGEVVE